MEAQTLLNGLIPFIKVAHLDADWYQTSLQVLLLESDWLDTGHLNSQSIVMTGINHSSRTKFDDRFVTSHQVTGTCPQ